MNLVRADVGEFVLARIWIPRKHCLESFGLSGNEFILRQAWGFSVRNAPHAVLGDLGSHVPLMRVDYEVGVLKPEAFEIIVHLKQHSVIMAGAKSL